MQGLRLAEDVYNYPNLLTSQSLEYDALELLEYQISLCTTSKAFLNISSDPVTARRAE